MSNTAEYIRIDPERGSFRVNQKVFADQTIFEQELQRVFDKCWLYVGHETELPEPNSHLIRTIAGRPLILSRDGKGKMHCFLNICPHRGAQLVREKKGTGKTFTCVYHGWSWNGNGDLIYLQGEDGFCPNFNAHGEVNMKAVPRFDSYRGLCFVSFDPDIMDLTDYLAGAKEYIDLIMDQSDQPMEVVGGTQEYSVRCNWKGLAENSIDIYHGPNTHPSYVDYLISQMPGVMPDLETAHGHVSDLGNGHGVAEYHGPWGRPVADWKPSLGDKIKPEIEVKMRELEARLGPERAQRVAKNSFNMLIFPNLVLLNIHTVAIRLFQPVRTNYMDTFMWILAPKGESEEMRRLRLHNGLEFLGAAGFANPDDIEVLETCQASFELSKREELWNEISKGMNREGHEHWMDEGHMRAFWRQWNRLMTQGGN